MIDFPKRKVCRDADGGAGGAAASSAGPISGKKKKMEVTWNSSNLRQKQSICHGVSWRKVWKKVIRLSGKRHSLIDFEVISQKGKGPILQNTSLSRMQSDWWNHVGKSNTSWLISGSSAGALRCCCRCMLLALFIAI